MEAALGELEKALRERVQVIADEESRRVPEQHLVRLQQISEKIEEIERRLPREIDPQLRHFLERRSYSKALDLLKSQPD